MEEILLEYVCPILGIVTANVMFLAPVTDCYKAILSGQLHTLNPTPWAFMLGNCFGWVTYGILIENIFILFGNGPGLILSIWLNLQAVKMQYASFRTFETRKAIVSALQQQDGVLDYGTLETQNNDASIKSSDIHEMAAFEEQQSNLALVSVDDVKKAVWESTAPQVKAPASQDSLVIANILVWMALVALISYSDFSHYTKKLIIGVAVNCNLAVFYAAPLSTIWTVLHTRSSSTIHVPTMLTNTCNGAFWAAYGLAIQDLFVALAQIVGVLLGVTQIILCLVFPRKQKVANDDDDDGRDELTEASSQHQEVTAEEEQEIEA